MCLNVIHHRLLWLFLLVIAPVMVQASLEAAIEGLLNQADVDMEANRLMLPAHQNAFDRYQAVLLLDKGNRRAVLGLQSIADRYIALAQGEVQRGDFFSARRLLSKAVTVAGRTSTIERVDAEIQKAEIKYRQAQQVQEVEPSTPRPNVLQTVFNLDSQQLSQRHPQMVAELRSLGQRVKASKEYILIHARNDAEGRWIYQQMRKASGYYRLRGDIKRHPRPKVVLKSPLE